MDVAEIVTTLVAAGIGVLAALYGARWSFRRVAEANQKDQLSAEIAALRATDMELAVARRIAAEMSPTPLPTQMLFAALPSIHHMNDHHRGALVEYTQSALRYNGRVERIIAFGSGKRAFGLRPGAEKPTSQAKRVLVAGPAASTAISEHLRSSRFLPQDRTTAAAARKT